ncbi:TolB family protein [Cellulomonas aerilata]|uniref:Lipoprotein LpqB beta-propeller domain-containing protein n=1 Tax=Cellulomonas aerilata TaxID=515326 RepID=A0A512DBE5_9CELL|nr:PD40 domain-containing protein [Cellulomonas aerilata]GEO33802.1 hypothetical protein CAE01nite_15270 [Cellulomonas aerilata]
MSAYRTTARRRGARVARRLLAGLAAATAVVAGLAASPAVAAEPARGRCDPLIAYREGFPIGRDSKVMGVPGSGGEPHALYDGPLSELDPDWSPDGRLLVFATRLNLDGVVSERGLDVVDVTTGEVRTVLRQESFTRFPEWSPRGREIAYVSAEGGRGPLTAVRVVRSDGTRDRLVVAVPEGEVVQDLAWEPHGRTLWITSRVGETQWRLRSVDLRTGELQPLDSTRGLGYPRFAHGRRLVVEADEVGPDGRSHASLYVTDRRTLQPLVRLFGVADDQWSPALAPDGDEVAYLRAFGHPTAPHALEVLSLRDATVRPLVGPILGDTQPMEREGLSWQPKGRCVAGFPY